MFIASKITKQQKDRQTKIGRKPYKTRNLQKKHRKNKTGKSE
jgi:hypothetical protein